MTDKENQTQKDEDSKVGKQPPDTRPDPKELVDQVTRRIDDADRDYQGRRSDKDDNAVRKDKK
jgi:hypothetical protein